MFLSDEQRVKGPLLYRSRQGDSLSAGAVSSDRGARSFLSHLVSDPHAKNIPRVARSAWLRIPRLADGAFESLHQVIDIVLRIIYGGGGAGSEAELAYVECVRETAETTNLGCLAPVFEAPGACQARDKFP